VQSAGVAYNFYPWSQVKMISIGKNQSDADLL